MPSVADAALDQQERELLDRLVAELRRVYGDDLDGVWLYGSRARGERVHDESDVDVLVVTRSARDDKPLIPAVWRVLEALGNPRIYVDARQPPLIGSPPERSSSLGARATTDDSTELVTPAAC